MGIDDRLDNHGARGCDCLSNDGGAVRRIIDDKSVTAASPGKRDEVYWLQFTGKFWISEKRHLPHLI